MNTILRQLANNQKSNKVNSIENSSREQLSSIGFQIECLVERHYANTIPKRRFVSNYNLIPVNLLKIY